MFVGRHAELSRIRGEFAQDRPSLLLIYGRRRVGKSELIREAARDRPHVIYQATRVTSALNIEAFKAEIARVLGGDPLLDSIQTWLGVLVYLGRQAREMPGLVVVLDEFPYLIDTEPALPSIVQKFWDGTVSQDDKLNLVLCGSAVSQMQELLAERNPLYGRKTLSLDLGPLPLRDATRFFAGYTPEERMTAYGIVGGIPFYLRLWNPAATIERNVVDLLLTDTGALVDEPTVLLQAELRDIQRYASIMAAVADGCTKYGEIMNRLGFSEAQKLSPYLDKLEHMRLIHSAKSMDAPAKSRDRRYRMADRLMLFWHTYVRPNLSSIGQGFGTEVWRLKIEPHLSHFTGGVFEDICRENARSHAQERLPAPAREIGQIWAADYDIDVAGELLDGSMLYGEVKWAMDQAGEGILDLLVERAGRTSYGRGNERRHYAIYARRGFRPALAERAASDPSVLLYDPAAMLGLS
jgi:AAA+ ATPase superfamily predicted ATPase